MTAARANSQLDRTLFTKIKRGHPFTAAQIRNARCDRLLYRMLVVQWDSVTLHDCFRNIAVTPIIPHIPHTSALRWELFLSPHERHPGR